MTSAGSLRTPIEAALVGRLLDRPPSSARLPVGALTRAEKAAELQRVVAVRAMAAAYEAELVLGLAADTPDTLDPPADQPGARRGSWAPEPELPGCRSSSPPSWRWCSTAAAGPQRTRITRTTRPPGLRSPMIDPRMTDETSPPPAPPDDDPPPF